MTSDKFFNVLAALSALDLVTLHNARGEFACNSSSSHSVLVLPPEGLTAGSFEETTDGSFHDSITVTSSTGKIRYLAALLAQRGDADLAAHLRSTIKDWAASDTVESDGDFVLPQDRFGDTSEEFVLELAAFLKRPDVAIYGSEDYEPEGSTPLPLPRFEGWLARRDEVEGRTWWVLFSVADGSKIRLSFNDPREEFTPEKAAAPELVDVKLTDRCPFELDCGFCYMGSTRKGAEASLDDVIKILTALSEMGTFEVAFGGGEPTLWPHFEEVMLFTRSLGMVPNFTTKNFSILKDESLLGLAGSIAFSVTDRRSFERLVKVLGNNSVHHHELCLQVIPEILPDDLLEDIFSFAAEQYLRLTLLGYKFTGRGGEFDGRIKREPGFWVPLAKRHRYLRLSIDTTLAQSSQEALEASGVPRWSYHTTEGSFSMYCDAVLKKAAPSSYNDPTTFDSLDMESSDLSSQLTSLFRGY